MYGISDRDLQELRSILSSIPNIEEAIIYGSRARGDYKKGSDIDLSIKGRDLSFHDLSLLDDKLYYSYIPYFFDTNSYYHLSNPNLIANINKDGKVLYSNNITHRAKQKEDVS